MTLQIFPGALAFEDEVPFVLVCVSCGVIAAAITRKILSAAVTAVAANLLYYLSYLTRN